MNLCKYKNAFGELNTGTHYYKIFNISIMDVIITIMAAGFISYMLKTPFFLTTIFLFFCGIVAHRIFCVRTTIDKLLFPA